MANSEAEKSTTPGTSPLPARCIIGVGASAGGLEAFSQLLASLPEAFEPPILFVQHLAPEHESHLTELLGSVSSIPVTEARDGSTVERGTVYVIPPNVTMAIRDGRLELSPLLMEPNRHGTVDVLFNSLAEYAGERAIGVVLSGTASDGAAGLARIYAAGGIALVQSPDSAKHNGMPRAAIATGVVELALTPQALAGELARLAESPFVRRETEPPETGDDAEAGMDEASFRRVLALLQQECGAQFHEYKTATVQRRLHRRMAIRKASNVDDYLIILEKEPNEVRKLYEDILIHVTSFFREPTSFEALAATVFPSIVDQRTRDAHLRIWIPGCSSGEEAYSVAMKLIDFLGARSRDVPVQIFATDIAEISIEQARSGLFPPTIAESVGTGYLRRFFKEEETGYRVHKSIRDLVIFAQQDLTRDPPFSRLDLIVCRNVLIYMTEALQRRIMTLFRYALNPHGYLMLGSSETTGLKNYGFSIVDKKARIYRNNPGAREPFLNLPVDRSRAGAGAPESWRGRFPSRRSIFEEARRVSLQRYAPASVLVDSELAILDTHGRTGDFLELAPGEPNLHVLRMARQGLGPTLKRVLDEAAVQDTQVHTTSVRVHDHGHTREVGIDVVPIHSDGRRYFLIHFELRGERAAPPEPVPSSHAATQLERGEREVLPGLAESGDYFQSIIDDLEAANEELQSANEQILSSNEELQSTNEELDTAKEELQSTNEELNTINEELEARNTELTRVNSDLINLVANVEVSLIIVSRDLRIRRITPLASSVLNVIPSDIGRPIGQIKPNLILPELESLLERCIVRVEPIERQVRDVHGRWYSLRIRPYQDIEDRIDGAVLTVFDVDSMHRRETELEAGRRFAAAIVETFREPIVVVDSELRVQVVNPAFVSLFGIAQETATGKPFYELGDGQWNVSMLRSRLEEVLTKRKPVDSLRVDASFEGLGPKEFLVHARRIESSDERPAMVLVTLEDVAGQAGAGP